MGRAAKALNTLAGVAVQAADMKDRLMFRPEPALCCRARANENKKVLPENKAVLFITGR